MSIAHSIPDMVPKRLAATHQPPLKAVSPADITVVTSAEQLQNATLTQAEDIEIRAHLDLRALNLADNPDIPGEESVSNRKRLALLYATHRLRSVRVRATISSTYMILYTTNNCTVEVQQD